MKPIFYLPKVIALRIFFFAEIGERVARELPNMPPIQLEGEQIEGELSSYKQLGIVSFFDIISSLKLPKSSGIEDLNSRVLIEAMRSIPHICLLLFVIHRSEREFPF